METRRTKDYNVPTERLQEYWRSRAAELGFGREEIVVLLDRRPAREPEKPDLAAEAERIAESITEQRSTFDRRDVLREWAEAHREGVGVERVERLTDRWLASRHAVQVSPNAERPQLGGPRYSTPEMLVAEERVLDAARERQGANVARLDARNVDERLTAYPDLSEEQRMMVRRLTTSGDGVKVVRAAAGIGKTYALSAARDLWEDDGVRVYGVALAARAALEMENRAGIDSTTIARFLQDVDQGNGLAWGSVLVVDEAGMVGTRALDRLVSHTSEVGAKIVLVGDDRQLPEIEAGGVFRSLAEKMGAVELHQVHRQAAEWDRDALVDLRRGDVARWADEYREHGRIVVRPNAYDLRATLVDDWWRAANTGRGRRDDRQPSRGRLRPQRARARADASRRAPRQGRACGGWSRVRGRRSGRRPSQRPADRRRERHARRSCRHRSGRAQREAADRRGR